MAMNLRLGRDAQEAVRREAERSGRSQQEVIREAVGRHLGVESGSDRRGALGALISSGVVRAPRHPYRRVATRLALGPGETTERLLDRDDRI